MDDASTQSFVSLLLTDVADSLDRHERSASQAAKRNLVRTTFAALEGAAWIFREHVIDAARTTSNLEPAEIVALSEISYQVTEQGRITEQPRYLSLLATVRLTARIAEKLAPDVKIDFSGADWASLKQAIKVRNRITHPKSKRDLVLSDDDILISTAALFWLLAETGRAMAATNVAIKEFLERFSEILNQLKAGDPAVLAEYRAAARSLQGDVG